MSIFDEIEKLITEHGSAAILKERNALLRDQFNVLNSQKHVLEEEINLLKTKIVTLEKEIQRLNEDNKNLEINNSNLESQLNDLHTGNPDKHFCDHCGSSNLKRTGSKPVKQIAGVTIKNAIYTCKDCGKESAFTEMPK